MGWGVGIGGGGERRIPAGPDHRHSLSQTTGIFHDSRLQREAKFTRDGAFGRPGFTKTRLRVPVGRRSGGMKAALQFGGDKPWAIFV
jgi:hypothetical protein